MIIYYNYSHISLKIAVKLLLYVKNKKSDNIHNKAENNRFFTKSN